MAAEQAKRGSTARWNAGAIPQYRLSHYESKMRKVPSAKALNTMQAQQIALLAVRQAATTCKAGG